MTQTQIEGNERRRGTIIRMQIPAEQAKYLQSLEGIRGTTEGPGTGPGDRQVCSNFPVGLSRINRLNERAVVVC